MTLGHGLLLLFLGVTSSIGLFVLLGKLEKSIEKDKKEENND
jgi:hypothetical protein